jgi:hypothetical protein
MISSVISLIHPLKFMGDYRPYITLYDDDIKALSNEKNISLIVMGTCNPYLANMFDKFPAILHLEKEYYLENKLIASHQMKLSEFLRVEGHNIQKYIGKVLKTKDKLSLLPNRELLEKLKEEVMFYIIYRMTGYSDCTLKR